MVLGLTYDTTPEQIESGGHPDSHRVRCRTGLRTSTFGFSGFGDFSLNVTCIFHPQRGALGTFLGNQPGDPGYSMKRT